jgi:Cu(I)/Ag(I) efflux system periplasmic protein CusF
MKECMIVCNVRRVAAALLLLGLPASGSFAQAPLADGKVVKIDQAAGKITIQHGPLKQFDMDESMTMVYRAVDPTMLAAVKPGDKIRFVPGRVNGQFTVTKIEKAR